MRELLVHEGIEDTARIAKTLRAEGLLSSRRRESGLRLVRSDLRIVRSDREQIVEALAQEAKDVKHMVPIARARFIERADRLLKFFLAEAEDREAVTVTVTDMDYGKTKGKVTTTKRGDPKAERLRAAKSALQVLALMAAASGFDAKVAAQNAADDEPDDKKFVGVILLPPKDDKERVSEGEAENYAG